MAFGQIAIARTTKGPRDNLPTPRFLHPSTPRAFVNLGAFLLRHHALPLGEQLSLRRITKRVLQETPVHLQCLNLRDQ